MRRPLVLLWSDAWIDLAATQRAARGHCRITDDRASFARADAVLFPVPTMGAALPSRRAHRDQLWVLWCQESAVHYPRLDDATFTERFDLLMTYRLDSDVPVPYVSAGTFAELRPPTPLAARESTLVSAWVSSAFDRCGRDQYLLDLMSQLPTHSYGRIGRNRDLLDDTGTRSKMATIGGYRFTVAFENSIARDYVTEKFFQPLLAGSVPLYRGAPNVADFAPAPQSYIDVSRFASAGELADFLSAMTDDDYEAHHAWRDEGASDEFRRRFERYDVEAFVRLARTIEILTIGRRAARLRSG